jgi:hypothetical protein
VSEVLIPAPGIDDEVDVLVVHLGDDGVADGAALLIGEDREGAGAVLEAHDVGDDEGLEEGDGLAAHEAEAAHVGARWEELEGGDGESDGVLVRRRGDASRSMALRGAGWGRRTTSSSGAVSMGCGASPAAASAAPAAARPAACNWAAALLRRRPLLRPLQREGAGAAFRSRGPGRERGPNGSGDGGSVDESESAKENLTV